MRLSPEAARDHQRLIRHTIAGVTEQFRQVRMAELDDSGINPYDESNITPCDLCHKPSQANPCRRCTACFPEIQTMESTP